MSSAQQPDGAARHLGLDPQDWDALRAACHEMLDAAVDSLQHVRDRPVWQPMPAETVDALDEPVPKLGRDADELVRTLVHDIMPYASGQVHPRFLGWVHGTGTADALIAEICKTAMNINAGGRNHVGAELERRVIAWCRELFGFPDRASGVLVTGTSMATVICLAVARNRVLGGDARATGLQSDGPRLAIYTSAGAHSSVAKAAELIGIGNAMLRPIALDDEHRMRPGALRRAIVEDRERGIVPCAVVATSGSVNTGAFDPLGPIADICAGTGVWLHVDAAFGGIAIMSETHRHLLAGIDRADSLAFDFHKWMHVPYAVACALVRDGAAHEATFSTAPAYLKPAERGLAAGRPWPCDFGIDLSRPCHALPVWFAFQRFGTERIGAAVSDNCRLAQVLVDLVRKSDDLELLAPAPLQIVCLRYRPDGIADERVLDELNDEIVMELHVRGLAAPSTTSIGGRLAIRVNLTNHRTRDDDVRMLVDSIRAIGAELAARVTSPC